MMENGGFGGEVERKDFEISTTRWRENEVKYLAVRWRRKTKGIYSLDEEK